MYTPFEGRREPADVELDRHRVHGHAAREHPGLKAQQAAAVGSGSLGEQQERVAPPPPRPVFLCRCWQLRSRRRRRRAIRVRSFLLLLLRGDSAGGQRFLAEHAEQAGGDRFRPAAARLPALVVYGDAVDDARGDAPDQRDT